MFASYYRFIALLPCFFSFFLQTIPPGEPLAISTNPLYPGPGWKVATIDSSDLTFLMNDGANNWDHAYGGGNYRAASNGVYTLKDGLLTKTQDLSGGW